MRQAIFRKYIQVIIAVLILNSIIFYTATSGVLLNTSKRDMLYTLRTMDYLLDYNSELKKEIHGLKMLEDSHNNRLTIIGVDGWVVADTGISDVGGMESHLLRPEVVAARTKGYGYAKRYSSTLKRNMMYLAIQSQYSEYILRMAIPVTGLQEYLFLLFLAMGLSFLIALVFSASSADNFAKSIAKPLKLISQEMLKVNGDYTELVLDPVQYEEINIIAETTAQMSENIKDYLGQIERERQIRQEFFSNASHELKTPITSIQGYAELIESGIVQDEEQKLDFIRRIKKEASSMTGLINDILMISRLETKEAEVIKSDVRISVILEDILDSLKPLAVMHQIQIHVDCVPVCMFANAQQMTELLRNLISNAIKYNRPGGDVWVTVKEENHCMVIRVRDNGMGIPEESIDRIFERFYRVDKGRSRKQGGTGLGLSIVKHIVNFYQGNLVVSSKVDEGTEFTVTIPFL